MALRETHEFINKLRLVSHGLLAIPFLAFIIFYLRTDKGKNIKPLLAEETAEIVFLTILSVVIGLMLYAYFYYFSKLKIIRAKSEMAVKLQEYRVATIIKFAIFEAAMIFSLAGLVITAQKIFIFTFLMVLFAFSIENPSIRKLFRHLRLTKEEKTELMAQE